MAAVAITEGAQRHSTNAPLLKGLGMLFRMISAVGLGTRIAAGNRVEAFADAAPEADVILNWTDKATRLLHLRLTSCAS